MRYGFTTHALIASTITIAPTIVTSQSIVTRQPCGSPSVKSVDRIPQRDLLPSPAFDLRVVTREQHAGHPPPAELRGTRVVRVLKPAAELGGERLELAGAFGERARQPPRDRVEEDHRRQVAVREDVRADRDRVGREVLDDPLVEPLEPRREERQPLLGRKLLDDGLRQLAALRRQRDDAMRGNAAVDRVERRRDDVDPQHHAGAAAVRLVVHLPGAQRRVVAVGVAGAGRAHLRGPSRRGAAR